MILAAFVSNAEISGARRGGRLYNKIAGHATRTRRFTSFSVYGVGAAFASFLPPLPAFTSTWVADIV